MTTCTTTELNKHMGVAIPAEVLLEMGIEPANRAKRGFHWNVSDIPAIWGALANYAAMQSTHQAPTAVERIVAAKKPADLTDDDTGGL